MMGKYEEILDFFDCLLIIKGVIKPRALEGKEKPRQTGVVVKSGVLIYYLRSKMYNEVT